MMSSEEMAQRILHRRDKALRRRKEAVGALLTAAAVSAGAFAVGAALYIGSRSYSQSLVSSEAAEPASLIDSNTAVLSERDTVMFTGVFTEADPFEEDYGSFGEWLSLSDEERSLTLSNGCGLFNDSEEQRLSLSGKAVSLCLPVSGEALVSQEALIDGREEFLCLVADCGDNYIAFFGLDSAVPVGTKILSGENIGSAQSLFAFRWDKNGGQTNAETDLETVILTEEEYGHHDPFAYEYGSIYGCFDNLINNHIVLAEEFLSYPQDTERAAELPEEARAHRTRTFEEYVQIAADEGGTVVFARRVKQGLYTHFLVIDNGSHYTAYLGMRTLSLGEGDRVQEGDILGTTRDICKDGEFLGFHLRAFRWDKVESVPDPYAEYSVEQISLNPPMLRLEGGVINRICGLEIPEADSGVSEDAEFVPMTADRLGEYYGMGGAFGELHSMVNLLAQPQYTVSPHAVYRDSSDSVCYDRNTVVFQKGSEKMTITAAGKRDEYMVNIRNALSGCESSAYTVYFADETGVTLRFVLVNCDGKYMMYCLNGEFAVTLTTEGMTEYDFLRAAESLLLTFAGRDD